MFIHIRTSCQQRGCPFSPPPPPRTLCNHNLCHDIMEEKAATQHKDAAPKNTGRQAETSRQEVPSCGPNGDNNNNNNRADASRLHQNRSKEKGNSSWVGLLGQVLIHGEARCVKVRKQVKALKTPCSTYSNSCLWRLAYFTSKTQSEMN